MSNYHLTVWQLPGLAAGLQGVSNTMLAALEASWLEGPKRIFRGDVGPSWISVQATAKTYSRAVGDPDRMGGLLYVAEYPDGQIAAYLTRSSPVSSPIAAEGGTRRGLGLRDAAGNYIFPSDGTLLSMLRSWRQTRQPVEIGRTIARGSAGYSDRSTFYRVPTADEFFMNSDQGRRVQEARAARGDLTERVIGYWYELQNNRWRAEETDKFRLLLNGRVSARELTPLQEAARAAGLTVEEYQAQAANAVIGGFDNIDDAAVQEAAAREARRRRREERIRQEMMANAVTGGFDNIDDEGMQQAAQEALAEAERSAAEEGVDGVIPSDEGGGGGALALAALAAGALLIMNS